MFRPRTTRAIVKKMPYFPKSTDIAKIDHDRRLGVSICECVGLWSHGHLYVYRTVFGTAPVIEYKIVMTRNFHFVMFYAIIYVWTDLAPVFEAGINTRILLYCFWACSAPAPPPPSRESERRNEGGTTTHQYTHWLNSYSKWASRHDTTTTLTPPKRHKFSINDHLLNLVFWMLVVLCCSGNKKSKTAIYLMHRVCIASCSNEPKSIVLIFRELCWD